MRAASGLLRPADADSPDVVVAVRRRRQLPGLLRPWRLYLLLCVIAGLGLVGVRVLSGGSSSGRPSTVPQVGSWAEALDQLATTSGRIRLEVTYVPNHNGNLDAATMLGAGDGGYSPTLTWATLEASTVVFGSGDSGVSYYAFVNPDHAAIIGLKPDATAGATAGFRRLAVFRAGHVDEESIRGIAGAIANMTVPELVTMLKAAPTLTPAGADGWLVGDIAPRANLKAYPPLVRVARAADPLATARIGVQLEGQTVRAVRIEALLPRNDAHRDTARMVVTWTFVDGNPVAPPAEIPALLAEPKVWMSPAAQG